MERLGYPVTVVDGDPANRKVTFRGDLEGHEMMETRTGLGYDVHRFSEEADRPLWLGGVQFEGEGPGLEGHSDADALLHAVVDAVWAGRRWGTLGSTFRTKILGGRIRLVFFSWSTRGIWSENRDGVS